MQRYNLFNQGHKALKAMLYDTALCLQQTEFTNDEESDAGIYKVIELVQLFSEHEQSEKVFVLPLLTEYEPSVADAFGREQVLYAKLSLDLNEAVTELCNAASNDEKVTKGCALSLLFTRFLTATIKRINKEESVLNKILWQYYSDYELIEVERKIMQRLPSETQPAFTRWMLRGMNRTETVQWLKGVEQSASEPAFKALFATAQKELPKRKFLQVLESLTEGVMLA
jgi:hypothetical protein